MVKLKSEIKYPGDHLRSSSSATSHHTFATRPAPSAPSQTKPNGVPVDARPYFEPRGLNFPFDDGVVVMRFPWAHRSGNKRHQIRGRPTTPAFREGVNPFGGKRENLSNQAETREYYCSDNDVKSCYFGRHYSTNASPNATKHSVISICIIPLKLLTPIYQDFPFSKGPESQQITPKIWICIGTKLTTKVQRKQAQTCSSWCSQRSWT